MIGPPPDLTLVLTCMLVLQLTVIVHTKPCTTFNSRLCSHRTFSLSEKLFRMWNRHAQTKIDCFLNWQAPCRQ